MDERCLNCQAIIEPWDGGYYARQMLCISCFDIKQQRDRYKPCQKCGVRKLPNELKLHKDRMLCGYCLREEERLAATHECAFCHKWLEDWQIKERMRDQRPVCDDCANKHAAASGAAACERCGKAAKFPYNSPDGQMMCEHCSLRNKGRSQNVPLLSHVVDRLMASLA